MLLDRVLLRAGLLSQCNGSLTTDAEGILALVEGVLSDMQHVAEALANAHNILARQRPASTARELKRKYQEATE